MYQKYFAIFLLETAKTLLLDDSFHYLCNTIPTDSEEGLELRREIRDALEGNPTLEDYLEGQGISKKFAPQARLAWVDKMIYDRTH